MVHCVNRVIKVVFRPASEGFSLRRQDMQHGGHGAQMTQQLRKEGGGGGRQLTPSAKTGTLRPKMCG